MIMDSTLSVSKGCFVFKPERGKKHKSGVRGGESWRGAFEKSWRLIEGKIQEIHDAASSEVLAHMVGYLRRCRSDPVFADIVPAVALLTGVSVPDHAALFATVCEELREGVSPHVASLHGDECSNLKAALERLVSQFVCSGHNLDETITEFKVKKSECTFAVLSAWYKSLCVDSNWASEEDSLHQNALQSSISNLTGRKTDSMSSPSKSEFSANGSPIKEFSTCSPRNSSKKSKSPFKSLCTPTKSPRKLMIARKLLLQSPEASKVRTSVLPKASTSEKKRAKNLLKRNMSFCSPSKFEDAVSPSKSPAKAKNFATQSCKAKVDLFGSLSVKDSFNDGFPSPRCSAEGNKICSKSLESPDSPSENNVTPKKCFSANADSETLLHHKIRESLVVVTPLKSHLIDSSRRLSFKRPALDSPSRSPEAKRPCRSPESKKRKDVLLPAGQVVCFNRDTLRKAAVNVATRKPLLVVVIPDFESFPPTVLNDLILIASGYVQELPLVFVFGVATTVSTVHRSLPHHVSSKVCIQVFQCRSSLDLLNQVVDQVLLWSDCPVMLGGRVFRLLTDIFLFYDFSVQAFVQRLKFCVLEHFSRCCAMTLCCPADQLRGAIRALRRDELEQLRGLPSFRRHVESRPRAEQAPLLLDDQYFRMELESLVRRLREHVPVFLAALRCLHALTADLPRAPLGRNLRELYAMSVSSAVANSAQYGECRRLLDLQSREELESRLATIVGALAGGEVGDLARALPRWLEQLQLLSNQRPSPAKSPVKSPAKLDFGKHLNRSQFRQKICEVSRKVQPVSAYEQLRKEVLDCLMEVTLPQYLVPPTSLALHEVLLFDQVSVKRQLVPSPRAALHTALNCPHHYLQCDCCKLPDESAILTSMPDICIAYKLHLESGRLVNLYDWLQAFVAVVCPGDGEESREVDPRVQARFTQAVAELQFLGFVKASKKKTDHVMRTTWGAC